MRTQVYGAFGTLSLGMRVLEAEGVELDTLFAHGGLFRTAGVAQRLLAAAVRRPGRRRRRRRARVDRGGWRCSPPTLACRRPSRTSAPTCATEVFADAAVDVVEPDAADLAGFAAFLERYEAGLAIERAAVEATARPGLTEETDR